MVRNAVHARRVADDFLAPVVVRRQRNHLSSGDVRAARAVVRVGGVAAVTISSRIVRAGQNTPNLIGHHTTRCRGARSSIVKGGHTDGGLGGIWSRSRRFSRGGTRGTRRAVSAAAADLAQVKVCRMTRGTTEYCRAVWTMYMMRRENGNGHSS